MHLYIFNNLIFDNYLLNEIFQIVKRVISENVAGGELLLAALALIRSSRFGLFEAELLELLAVDPILPENLYPEITFKSALNRSDKISKINTQTVLFHLLNIVYFNLQIFKLIKQINSPILQILLFCSGR